MLTKADWHEGRCVDINKIEEKFKRCKLSLFPAAKDFIAEFNDLAIELPSQTVICLDALKALDYLQKKENDLKEIKSLYTLLDKELCPVGWDGRSIHLISADHKYVILWEWISIIINENFETAMTGMVISSYKLEDFIELKPGQIQVSYRE